MTLDLTKEFEGKKIGFGTGPRGVEPDRPTVILLHGSGGSRLSWYAQVRPLDKDINVITLELPGHGETPGPPLADVAEMAAWVDRVVESWALPRKPVLCGHSLGGAVTLEIGITHPGPFNGLIPLGAGARLPVNPALIEALKNDYQAAAAFIVKWAYAKDCPQSLKDSGLRALSRNNPELVASNFIVCSRFDRTSDLARIGLPTLVICGTQDKMTPPDLSEELAAGIPGARLELISGGGHMVKEEQPEALNALIVSFLNEVG